MVSELNKQPAGKTAYLDKLVCTGHVSPSSHTHTVAFLSGQVGLSVTNVKSQMATLVRRGI